MNIFKTIAEDVRAVKERDPAAQSSFVIWLTYPGLHARWSHVVEHWLWNHGLKSLARISSQFTRFMTGVEIHPGAQIGRRFFIDHAMGVIIGETTIIGDDCTLYQGVTLGGTGNETGKRHPTLGNNVIVGVGAAVLGNITVGDNSKIGGGAVAVKDVPPTARSSAFPGALSSATASASPASSPPPRSAWRTFLISWKSSIAPIARASTTWRRRSPHCATRSARSSRRRSPMSIP